MKNQLIVICANDAMELAFLPDTPQNIIQKEVDRIKAEYLEKYPPAYEGQPPTVYIHTHEIAVFEKGMITTVTPDTELMKIIREWAGTSRIRNDHLAKCLKEGWHG